jgi:hypothetical protein
MEDFFDWLYARTWVVTVLTMVLLFLPMLYLVAGPGRKKKALRWIIVPLLFAPVVLIWAPMMSGSYGYADEPKEMYVCNGLFCFLDHYETGGEGPSEDIYRLYVADVRTGEKKFRKYTGTFSGLDRKMDGMLLYHDHDNFFVYDPAQDKSMKSYDPLSLPNTYPELRSGVERMDISPHQSVIRIEGKNGKKYYLEAFSGKLQDSDFAEVPDTSAAYVPDDDDDIYTLDKRGNRENVLSLDRAKGSDKLMELRVGEVEEKVKGLEFLDGDFIYYFRKERIAIIRSYETTDHTNFVLTAVSANGEKKWQIVQKDLDGEDYMSSNAYGCCTNYGNNLIFNSGYWYYSIDLNTAKVNWKKRF